MTKPAEPVHNVANSLYAVAMGEKPTMAKVVASIFLLKTQGRWRESQIIEHVGEDGAPLPDKPAAQIIFILPDNGKTEPRIHAVAWRVGEGGPTPLQIEGAAD